MKLDDRNYTVIENTKQVEFDFVVNVRPRAGSGVVRIDPFRFLAGCRKKRLNQALSVLSLSLDFFRCMCVVLLTSDSFRLCYLFMLFVCSVAWFFLAWQYQCKS